MKKEIKFYSMILTATVVCSFRGSAKEMTQLNAKEFALKSDIYICKEMNNESTILCGDTVYEKIYDEAVKLKIAEEALRVLSLNDSKRLNETTLKILADKIPDIEKNSQKQIKLVADIVKEIVQSDEEYLVFSKNPVTYLKNKGINEDFEIAPSFLLNLKSLAKHIKSNRLEIVEGLNDPVNDKERGLWSADTCEYALVDTERSSVGDWGDNDKINEGSKKAAASSKTTRGIANSCPQPKVIIDLIQKNLRENQNVDKKVATQAFLQSAFVGVSKRGV